MNTSKMSSLAGKNNSPQKRRQGFIMAATIESNIRTGVEGLFPNYDRVEAEQSQKIV